MESIHVYRWVLTRASKTKQKSCLTNTQALSYGNAVEGRVVKGTHPELADVMAANKSWVSYKNRTNPEYFKRMEGTHDPNYLYIGCSDARVDPGKLLGLGLGKLFVHRNVGNIVSGTDSNFQAVLEYAVGVLQVPHIIVCGHYDCGAVRGSVARDGPGGAVENWLRHIKDVNRHYYDELSRYKDREERHRRLVELNVIEQCLNVLKSGIVQQSRHKTRLEGLPFLLPRVHGLVFDPAQGVIKKMDLDWNNELGEIEKIYGLYADDESNEDDGPVIDKI